jgi:hypothetical protein
MVIIHELLHADKMSAKELALIDMLKKRKIISVVKIKDVIGVARAGTNRGKSSQLYKYVKLAS